MVTRFILSRDRHILGSTLVWCGVLSVALGQICFTASMKEQKILVALKEVIAKPVVLGGGGGGGGIITSVASCRSASNISFGGNVFKYGAPKQFIYIFVIVLSRPLESSQAASKRLRRNKTKHCRS